MRYCERCGRELGGGAFCEGCGAFCEGCGARAPSDRGTHAKEEGTPPAGPSRRRPPVALWLGAAGALLVGGVVAVVITVAGGGKTTTTTVTTVAAEQVPRTATASAPATVAAPPTVPGSIEADTPPAAPGAAETDDGALQTTTQRRRPAARRSYAATIVRTCGADGSSDCFASLRAGPHAGTTELGRLEEGARIRIVCQRRGESVRSSAAGRATAVWSRVRGGGYVTNAYLAGSRIEFDTMTLPRC